MRRAQGAQRPKVLIVVALHPTSSHPTDGGSERDHTIASSESADVRVIHIDRFHLGRSQPESVLPVHRTTFPTIHGWIGQVLALAVFPFQLLFFLRRERFTPGIIHSHRYLVAPHAWIAAILTRARWVHTERSSGFESGRVGWAFLRVARFLFRRKIDIIVPVSDHLKEQLIRQGFDGDWRVIWNAIDPSQFSTRTEEQNANGEVPRLLAVIRLNHIRRKNVSGLFRSLARLREHQWTLTYIGDGPAKPEALRIATSLGIRDRIHFTGECDRGDVARAMLEHDLLIHPASVETFSLVVAEALMSGLPVMAYPTGAIPEMLQETDGGLVVSDETELTDELARFLSGERQWTRHIISERARGILAMERLSRDLEKLYRDVLAN
jgi:glycosyltransferase involved in cell wall biosynthesis